MIGVIQYEKLFEPYTEDGHTLENTLKYLSALADKKGIKVEVLELAWNEIFSEMASGKEFPKDKCPCGCGIDKAATALIHAIRDRMFVIDNSHATAMKDLMIGRYQTLIVTEMKRISKADKEFIKMNRPPLKERSPVLRLIRWIFSQ